MRKILVTTSGFQAKGFAGDMQVVYNPYGRKLTEDELIELFMRHDPMGIIAGVDSVDIQALKERGIVLPLTPEARRRRTGHDGARRGG